MAREKNLGECQGTLIRARLSSVLPLSLFLSLFSPRLSSYHATGSSIGTPLLGEQFLKSGEEAVRSWRWNFRGTGENMSFRLKMLKNVARFSRGIIWLELHIAFPARTAIHWSRCNFDDSKYFHAAEARRRFFSIRDGWNANVYVRRAHNNVKLHSARFQLPLVLVELENGIFRGELF